MWTTTVFTQQILPVENNNEKTHKKQRNKNNETHMNNYVV